MADLDGSGSPPMAGPGGPGKGPIAEPGGPGAGPNADLGGADGAPMAFPGGPDGGPIADSDGRVETAPPATAGPRAVRVFFQGPADDAGSRLVVDMDEDGRPLVDGSTEAVTLLELGRPRYRLSTPAGSHEVLIARVAHPAGRATGVERFEVVVDGWRFEVDLEPEARARLRDRATSATATLRGAGRWRSVPSSPGASSRSTSPAVTPSRPVGACSSSRP